MNLKWKRNGNPTGVNFLVETRAATGPWEFVASTTKARVTVNGFAPGAQAWFRVTASKNDLTSLPSNEAPIYAGGAAKAPSNSPRKALQPLGDKGLLPLAACKASRNG